MFVDFSKLNDKHKVVGIACSGGKDSMALLHYVACNRKALGVEVVCINVEHGIRGEQSKLDSLFVKDFCDARGIPFYGYVVDCPTYSTDNKLSLEQGARVLRYKCFYDAIKTKKCDVIATAHHVRDNVESLLFNLFRGAGLSGLTGISDREDKIIRPFLNVSKIEIDDYVKENGVDYVTDASNYNVDFTRNYIRLKVLPTITEVFPEAEKSISRFIDTAKEEDRFLNNLANDCLIKKENSVKIPSTVEKPIFLRAVIIALKHLGLEKDWEKIHAEDTFNLLTSKNGTSINLPKNIVAIKEYDGVCIYKNLLLEELELPIKDGEYDLFNGKLTVKTIDAHDVDLKSGLYLAVEKIPETAKIRYKSDGDVFYKFGGGSKKLGDFFTDLKIPKRKRQYFPLVADDNVIYSIIGIAISELAKADKNTKKLYEIKFNSKD